MDEHRAAALPPAAGGARPARRCPQPAPGRPPCRAPPAPWGLATARLTALGLQVSFIVRGRSALLEGFIPLLFSGESMLLRHAALYRGEAPAPLPRGSRRQRGESQPLLTAPSPPARRRAASPRPSSPRCRARRLWSARWRAPPAGFPEGAPRPSPAPGGSQRGRAAVSRGKAHLRR